MSRPGRGAPGHEHPQAVGATGSGQSQVLGHPRSRLHILTAPLTPVERQTRTLGTGSAPGKGTRQQSSPRSERAVSAVGVEVALPGNSQPGGPRDHDLCLRCEHWESTDGHRGQQREGHCKGLGWRGAMGLTRGRWGAFPGAHSSGTRPFPSTGAGGRQTQQEKHCMESSLPSDLQRVKETLSTCSLVR